MARRDRSRRAALLLTLALEACAHTPGGTAGGATAADHERVVAALIAAGTAGSLATAAALSKAPPDAGAPDRSLELIARAQSLAPQRPELAWLHLLTCRRLRCGDGPGLEARLQALAPNNGFAFEPELERAVASEQEPAITAAIARIGAATEATTYWTAITVMMVDALAAAEPSRDAAERVLEAIGISAAIAIPPMQTIGKACRPERLDPADRRAACAALATLFERADTVLTQSFALSLEERWWPAGSPQRALLRAKRRRLDYLMVASGDSGWWRRAREMTARLDAMRRLAREEDVDIAVLESRGRPLGPPAAWRDAWHPD